VLRNAGIRILADSPSFSTAAAPAQIHQTFAISLPDCITLFVVPAGIHSPATKSAAGRGMIV